MRLDIVIPAHNEEASVGQTVRAVAGALRDADIEHEIVVVDDASTDRTGTIVEETAKTNRNVRCLRSPNPPGFGFAVRAGLDATDGDGVAIMMADLSDDPEDLSLIHI